MPTASGRPTADEKREAYRIKSREARQTVTALVTTPEWLNEQADLFVAGLTAHKQGQADGTVSTYARFEQWYEAGEEHEVRRIKIDEGKARANGVADVLEARGIETFTMMSFGIGAGRNGLQYGVCTR